MTNEPGDLVQVAASGAKWVFAGRFAERLLRFGTMVVLSRLLLPEEFGLFVLGLSVAGVVSYVRSLGIDAALIRRQDAFEPKVYGTAFAILSMGGILLYVGFYLVAPLLSWILRNESVLPVLRLVSLSIIIGAVSRVPLALLRKRLEFKSVAIAEVLGRLAFTAIAIALAVAGWGVWSLVCGYLARQAVTAIAIFLRSKWIPSMRFDRQVARELVSYGKFVAGSSLLHYLESNLDKLIIGRWSGAQALGLYGLGFSLATLVNAQIVQPLRQVMFPAYSRLQDDLKVLRRAYLKSLKYVVLIGAPISFGLAILAYEIISVVYTDRWIGAAPALQILAGYGLLRSIFATSAPMLRAIGRPSTEFRLIGLNVALIAPLMIPAVKGFGIVGAATAMLVAAAIMVGFLSFGLRSLIQVTAGDMLRAVLPGIFGASMMGLAILVLKTRVDLLETSLGGWALPLTILVGGAIYCVILWLIEKDEMSTIKKLLMSQMKSE